MDKIGPFFDFLLHFSVFLFEILNLAVFKVSSKILKNNKNVGRSKICQKVPILWHGHICCFLLS